MRYDPLMRTLLVPLLFAAAPLLAADDIQAAEKAWAQSVVKRDFKVLDGIFADQLIYAHSTGAIESKTEYLNRLRSGAQKYDTIDHHKIEVREFGNSAVAHSLLRMTGTSNGRPFDDELMALHLWVKQGGKWRLAAHQTTKLK